MSAACSLVDGAAAGSVARSRVRSRAAAACLALALCASATTADADEGGVSFWIPGFFGSMAATPQQPGWSWADIYYHTDVSASGNTAVARAITIGQFNPTVNVNINANIHGTGDIGFFGPTYVFATPVLGGQASLSVLGAFGRNEAALDGTIGVAVGGIPVASRTFDLQQTTVGFGDVVPQFSLRWNSGVNNYMVYLTGDVPVGLYSSSNLANMGLGHGAIDGGVGYTYFDEKTGHEFSVVTGLTGNFENTSTNYTNGIDWHLDWGASQFLTKQWQVGLVGYFYDQLTPDSGCAPVICPFESRVIGIGPQVGHLFPVGDLQGYVNIKGYGEFDNNARPDGWNVWLTFVLSPKAPASSTSQSPMITK
jgi:hypothetical protein